MKERKDKVTGTREDAERTMEKLARARYSLDGLASEMNLELAEVRARYELQIQAYQAEYDATEKILKDWARANRTAFGDGRTIEMVHGMIEARLGTPAVKLLPGKTDDEVLEWMDENPGWSKRYVRTIRELNREQIIADRDALSETELATMGLRIAQTERIHVTPKTESVA